MHMGQAEKAMDHAVMALQLHPDASCLQASGVSSEPLTNPSPWKNIRTGRNPVPSGQ